MKIILLGPPGSGKGTLAAKLAQEFGYLHLSTGDVFRKEIREKTKIGLEVKKILDSGGLVPDKITVKVLKEKAADKRNIILDGYPRTIAQAEEIKEWDIDAVINIDVSEEKIIERLSGRRTCEKCPQVYHLKYIPPPKKGKCACGGKLIQRSDEKPEVIKDRFKEYEKKTRPLIDYYQQKGLLKTVDGNPQPEKVYQKVKEIIKKLGK